MAPAVAVLEVPLLFEAGGYRTVDVRIVVSAPGDIQRRRVLQRPGMTEAKFETVVARQIPEAEKRARADFVVDTSRHRRKLQQPNRYDHH